MKRWEALLADLPQTTVDFALGLCLAIVDIATLLPYRHQLSPLAVALLLVVLQNLPLAWRRSRPVMAVAVIGTARVVYDILKIPFAPLPLGPAIAVFSVSDRSSAGTRRTVLVLIAALMATSQLQPGHNQPYDAIEAVLIMATAWIAGTLNRARRLRLSELAERVTSAERAAVEEREQIARELHDVVAHHVSVIAVQSEAALSLLPARPTDAVRSLDVIGSTSRQALAELRRLLTVMRRRSGPADVQPQPSLSTMVDLVEQARSTGLEVTLETLGKPRSLSPTVEANAFRIVQEALTNSLRYSSLGKAAVVLTYEPGYLTVSVTDSEGTAGPSGRSTYPGPRGPGRNGPGSPGLPRGSVADAAPGGGFGLAGITERVASFGGSLSFGPTPGGGFAVVARMPARESPYDQPSSPPGRSERAGSGRPGAGAGRLLRDP